jgi:hypothetical protein
MVLCHPFVFMRCEATPIASPQRREVSGSLEGVFFIIRLWQIRRRTNLIG